MIRFVSIVTPSFWPGFAALVQSLAENADLGESGYEILTICDADTAPNEWLASRQATVKLWPRDRLPRVTVLTPQQQGDRMEQALQKLAIFALPPELGPCVYIDSDMVCLGSLRELRQIEPLAAGCEVLCGFDTGRDPGAMAGVEVNTGLLVFQPDAEIFRQLQEVYGARHAEKSHKGDQDVFNFWLHTGHPIHRLGPEWNFAKRFQDQTGPRWCRQRIGQVKLLHFVGAKPWTSNTEINTFRECRYRWMEEIWWDYFERSGFAQHMENPPRRSIAFRRQWILPFTKPAILREHAKRLWRLARSKLPLKSQLAG